MCASTSIQSHYYLSDRKGWIRTVNGVWVREGEREWVSVFADLLSQTWITEMMHNRVCACVCVCERLGNRVKVKWMGGRGRDHCSLLVTEPVAMELTLLLAKASANGIAALTVSSLRIFLLLFWSLSLSLSPPFSNTPQQGGVEELHKVCNEIQIYFFLTWHNYF